MTNAILANADLRGANLSFARLSGADLRGAKLKGAVFRYARMIGAKLDPARSILPTPTVDALGACPGLPTHADADHAPGRSARAFRSR